jgi:lipocalin
MNRRLRPVLSIAVVAVAALAVACAPMGPARTTTVEQVDVERYLGTWYEWGSVKQFFSIGLVNTTADYSLRSDGLIRVENRGEYFFDGGPESRIVGSAAPVDSSNARLNVSFVGTATATPPGNYWIVDLDEDYQWAIVSDLTGESGFILARSKTVDEQLYAELVQRAAAKGVNTSNLTPTPQF